jgi:hypothetical protein
MPHRLRSLALGVSILLASVGAPAATGGAVACADERPHAGLVVDTGARVIALCVTLDAPEVSGLRLIELAGAQHGLSYGFGLGGAAVCRLDGVGPTGDDCFDAYPEYWGYWHGDGRGGWTWASSGAGSFRVVDGDVEGWAWGPGDTGTSHREPPAATIHGLCEGVGPAPEPSGSPAGSPPPTAEPIPTEPLDADGSSRSTSPTGASTTSRPDDDGHPEADRAREPSPVGSPSTSAGAPPSVTSALPSPEEVLAVGLPPSDGGGPTAGVLVAGALAALLTVGGWLRLRTKGTT